MAKVNSQWLDSQSLQRTSNSSASVSSRVDGFSDESVLYHYCIVRTDVPIGTICAQLLHAAGESSPGNLPPGTHAVALAAHSELLLLALEKKLIAKGIPHAAIREVDEPFCGQLMAIGIFPCDRALVRKELSSIPLIR